MEVIQQKRLGAMHRLRQEAGGGFGSFGPGDPPGVGAQGANASMRDMMEVMANKSLSGNMEQRKQSKSRSGLDTLPASEQPSLRTYTQRQVASHEPSKATTEVLPARTACKCCPAFLDGGDIGSLPLSSMRVKVYLVLENNLVKTILALVVIVNAVQVVYESDQMQICEFGTGDEKDEACGKVNGVLLILNWVYLGIYSFELLLRLMVDRMRFFSNKWDVFDFFIVAVGLASQVLSSALPSTGIFRLFRLSRLAKALHFIKLKGELHLMLHGMFSAARAIILGTILIASAVLLWSVAAVEFLGELNRGEGILAAYAELGCERCPRAWSSVWQACLSILSTTLMGDSWGTYALPMVERHPATVVVFVGTAFSIVLGLTNLILAVIVDRALQQACLEDERDSAMQRERELNLARKRFVEMCRQIDADNSGTLSLEEFFNAYDHVESFREGLTLMGVFQKHEIEVLFNMIDKDRTDSVGYELFASQLVTIKNQDLHALSAFIKHQLMELSGEVEDIKISIERMEPARSRWGTAPWSASAPPRSGPRVKSAEEILSKRFDSNNSALARTFDSNGGVSPAAPDAGNQPAVPELRSIISPRRKADGEQRTDGVRPPRHVAVTGPRGRSPRTSDLANELKILSDACSQQVDLALRQLQQQDEMAQRAIATCASLLQETLTEKVERNSLYGSEEFRLRAGPSRGLELLSSQSHSGSSEDLGSARAQRREDPDPISASGKCRSDESENRNAKSMDAIGRLPTTGTNDGMGHSGSTVSTRQPQSTYQSTALSWSGSGGLRGSTGRFADSQALSADARVQMKL